MHLNTYRPNRTACFSYYGLPVYLKTLHDLQEIPMCYNITKQILKEDHYYFRRMKEQPPTPKSCPKLS
jgi:hypothetical protein